MIRETGEDAPTAEYIKSTLRGGEEKIVSDKAQIYLQNAKRFPRTINDECCARLLLSTKEQFPDGPEAEEVLDFLLQYRRWFGQENGHLRYTRTRRTWDLPYTGVNIRDCIAITTCMSPAATGTASEARDR